MSYVGCSQTPSAEGASSSVPGALVTGTASSAPLGILALRGAARFLPVVRQVSGSPPGAPAVGRLLGPVSSVPACVSPVSISGPSLRLLPPDSRPIIGALPIGTVPDGFIAAHSPCHGAEAATLHSPLAFSSG